MKRSGYSLKPTIIKYTAAAVFCAVFGTVYEIFSHEVYTPFMYLAWLIPLLLGAIPYTLIMLTGTPHPSTASAMLNAFAVATLTAGSIMQGVLVIYGTTNRLMILYLIAGAVLLFAGITGYVTALVLRRRNAQAADRSV